MNKDMKKEEKQDCQHESISIISWFIGTFENDREKEIAVIACNDCGERAPAYKCDFI